jgi:orotate phosphoribosyltransferase
VAAQGILQAAADMLPFPRVMVSPYGPNRDNPIEGFYEVGDRAVLLHDVILSGHHPVECISKLRAAGLYASGGRSDAGACLNGFCSRPRVRTRAGLEAM